MGRRDGELRRCVDWPALGRYRSLQSQVDQKHGDGGSGALLRMPTLGRGAAPRRGFCRGKRVSSVGVMP